MHKSPGTPDWLFLENICCQCFIGCDERDLQKKQRVTLHIALATDTTRCAASDNVADAIETNISIAIKDLVEKSRFQLIETLAHAIARFCLESTTAETVRVKVTRKSFFVKGSSVSVEIVRNR